ncbi:MAG TPA: T9SS type A sorting domain-containing protein [Flavobacteriales bacterium]|jgi:hypothetical protein|nr:T9SS type A sorting domain-containing protein [Flavobacteriales bacterium]
MRTARLLLPVLLCTTLPLSAQLVVPDEAAGSTGTLTMGAQVFSLVRAADGHVWLRQNLGASAVAASATDTAGFGDLYQWGRWTDGHEDRESPETYATQLSPNNPVGLGAGDPSFRIGAFPTDWWLNGTSADGWYGTTASATNGIDPCTELGEGWALPTQEDWVVVLNAENITNIATGFSSNLKLPAAGSRTSDNGILINGGLHGNYWSSTSNSAYAKDLTISPAALNVDDDAYRGYGMCVRCLHKHLHVGIEENARPSDLQLYPNPSTGTFTLLGTTAVRSLQVFASDMRLVRTETLAAGQRTITLEAVPSGLYWVRAESPEGIRWSRLVIAR